MQLKAGIMSALVAASAVSATPIDNNTGLTQKHQVIQHAGQTCISQHQVNACASGFVPKYYRKANMPFVCREQFSKETIERAENGEQIEEFKNEQPTHYMQRNVPRACTSNTDQEAQNDDQDQDDQQQQGRRNWQPFRGARTGKQQQMSEQDAKEFERELNEKFGKNHVQYQVNKNLQQQQQDQQQQQQVPEQQKRQQAKQAIRNKWAQLPLHRMMKMSDNEVERVEYQLRQLIANQPQVANWVFKYDQQLPKLYSKLVETLAEDIMQPYWTEDEKLRSMVQDQITNAASRVYTWIVKQMVVERDQYRRQNKQQQNANDDDNDDQYGQQQQQQQQQQWQSWENEDVPEMDVITSRVWEAAQRELHNSEIEHTKQILNNFFEHTKQDRPEQYKKMFKTFEQYNLDKQESQRIAKMLLQLVISGIQISAPEHPSYEQQQQQQQTGDDEQQQQQLQRYHKISQFTEEQLREAENKLRSAVEQDWAEYFNNKNNDKETNEYENNWSDEQENEYQQQQQQLQQQQQQQQQQQDGGYANGLFGKLKVIFQRFENNIRGQSNNNNNNNYNNEDN